MPKLSAGIMLAIGLDPASDIPLHRQLYAGVRDAILSGRVRAATRLPSTRSLASDLSISRTTVLTAFRQLAAEGYLEARVGAGTRVADALPDDFLKARAQSGASAPSAHFRPALSRRGRLDSWVGPAATGGVGRPLRPGIPALDRSTLEAWARLEAKQWRRASRELLEYGDPGGHPPLREAIAHHVRAARAVRCDPNQVLILGGAQQALYLCAQTLLDPGDLAWIEDPGYPGARAALTSAGARLVPVPVDGEGLVLTAEAKGRPKLIYVTPSHQCPLGVTMSLPRRLELLRRAAGAGAWILEDDYDSEFRYAGRPQPSLQSLDRDGRVLYIGSFSKSLFPSLRIGFLVAPAALVDTLRRVRSAIDRHSPIVDQAVLAEFISEGHYERHLRRMRGLYSQRQDTLMEAARRELSNLLEVVPTGAGIYTIGWLPPEVDDRIAAQSAAAHGVEVMPLSTFCIRRPSQGALVLGYGAYDREEIRLGVQRLARALAGDGPHG
jgi:GntR family transcriptional regulator/MocR family aminotransferase